MRSDLYAVMFHVKHHELLWDEAWEAFLRGGYPQDGYPEVVAWVGGHRMG